MYVVKNYKNIRCIIITIIIKQLLELDMGVRPNVKHAIWRMLDNQYQSGIGQSGQQYTKYDCATRHQMSYQYTCQIPILFFLLVNRHPLDKLLDKIHQFSLLNTP